jgi:hypothetical protein
VTYGSFVVDIKDHKGEKERTRLTIGGDQIEYPGDKRFNNGKNSHQQCYFHLGCQIPCHRHQEFLFEHPPRAIRIYGNQLVVAASRNDRKVRFDRTLTGRKGIHRDSEKNVWIATGRHPRQRIVTTQSCQGCLSTNTTHTWPLDPRHSSHAFSLVVDDFGVKYVGREHAEHLMACIRNNYNISSDWNGGA